MPDPLGFEAVELYPGVNLFFKSSNQFKRVFFVIFIQQQLSRELASPTALLPRVLRRGTATYPETLDLERAQADLYGADLNTGVLKIGERHIMMFSISLPAEKYVNSAGLLGQGLQLLMETVSNPARDANGKLRAEYVTQESKQLMAEIQRLSDNKPAYARRRCVEQMFRNEPYGVYSLGDVSSLQSLDASTLSQYHQEVLSSNPISIYALGQFQPEQIVDLIQKNWTVSRNPKPVALPDTLVDVAVSERQQVDEAMDMGQGWLILGYRTGIARGHKDYYSMLVLNSIYGGSPFSRLFLQVREKAAMAYSAGSTYDSTKGVLFAMAGIDPSRRPEAQRLMEEHLADLAAGNIADDELQAARASVITQLRQREDSPGQIITEHLTGLINGRMDSTADAVAAVNRVTAAEVASVAAKIKLDTIYFLHPGK